MSTENEPRQSAAAKEEEKSFEQLNEEFERYKAKTKDWQTKVRDRDIKMREQLKESTKMCQEKDQQLEEELKRRSEVEAELNQLRQKTEESRKKQEEADHAVELSQAYEKALEEAQRTLRSTEEDNRKLRHDLAAVEKQAEEASREATSKLNATHEEALADAQAKISKLRSTVQSLEQEVSAERKLNDGSSFFQTKTEESVASSFEVIERADIVAHGTSMKRTFCLVQRRAERSKSEVGGIEGETLRWFELTTLRRLWDKWCAASCGELQVPKTKEEIIEAKLAAQREEFEGQVAEEVDLAGAELKREAAAERERVEKEYEKIVDGLQAEVQGLTTKLQTEKEESIAAQEEYQHGLQQVELKSSAAQSHAIENAVAEATNKFNQDISSLEKKCRELEDYKAKAQVALKRMKDGGSTTTQNSDVAPQKTVASVCSLGSQTDLVQKSSVATTTTAEPYPRNEAVDASPQPTKKESETPPSSPQFIIQMSRLQHETISLQEENMALQEKLEAALAKLSNQKEEEGSLHPASVTSTTARAEEEGIEVKTLRLRVLELEKNLALAEAQAKAAQNTLESQQREQKDSSNTSSPVRRTSESTLDNLDHSQSQNLNTSAASIRSSATSTAGGHKDGFNFDELLQRSEEAATATRARASVRKDKDVAEELRAQLQEERAKINQLKYELREATLMEEKHLAQEKLLKDQLREEERRNNRTDLVKDQADYVKNVLLQFMAASGSHNKELQKSLIPVVVQILQLSGKEKSTLEQSVAAAY